MSLTQKETPVERDTPPGLIALVGQFAVGRERHVEAGVTVLALDQLFRLLAIVLRPEALVESIVEEDVSFGLHPCLKALFQCIQNVVTSGRIVDGEDVLRVVDAADQRAFARIHIVIGRIKIPPPIGNLLGHDRHVEIQVANHKVLDLRAEACGAILVHNGEALPGEGTEVPGQISVISTLT